MAVSDRAWPNTTHDWRHDVDTDHLDSIRREAARYGAGGITHLILEVVAYAADEAASRNRRGSCLVELHPDGSTLITDNGRGTDTRTGVSGRPVRKPVMATRDLRSFDAPTPPLLGDGLARRGISTVAALSTWLVHTNRRSQNSWSQEYRNGRPATSLTSLPGNGTTGTTVHFLACAAVRAIADVTPNKLATALEPMRDVLEMTVIDLRTVS